MADRPCKPDADFKRLWRFLLPDTALPACGTPVQDESAPNADEKNAADRPPAAKAQAKRDG